MLCIIQAHAGKLPVTVNMLYNGKAFSVNASHLSVMSRSLPVVIGNFYILVVPLRCR